MDENRSSSTVMIVEYLSIGRASGHPKCKTSKLRIPYHSFFVLLSSLLITELDVDFPFTQEMHQERSRLDLGELAR